MDFFVCVSFKNKVTPNFWTVEYNNTFMEILNLHKYSAPLLSTLAVITASSVLGYDSMLRDSSVEREENQNAAWSLLNIFNRDDNGQNTRNVTWKTETSPQTWCLAFSPKSSILVSSDQWILFVPMGCHVPSTEEWLPSCHSTVKAWLVESCTCGCPSISTEEL
jgi:hypothetical protein